MKVSCIECGLRDSFIFLIFINKLKPILIKRGLFISLNQYSPRLKRQHRFSSRILLFELSKGQLCCSYYLNILSPVTIKLLLCHFLSLNNHSFLSFPQSFTIFRSLELVLLNSGIFSNIWFQYKYRASPQTVLYCCYDHAMLLCSLVIMDYSQCLILEESKIGNEIYYCLRVHLNVYALAIKTLLSDCFMSLLHCMQRRIYSLW